MKRNVTPLPTLPPRIIDDMAVAKRFEAWKVIIGVVAAIIGIGIAVGLWVHDVPKSEQVEQVRVQAASNLAAATSSASAQLGALATIVQSDRERMARIEAQLESITKTTDRLFDQVVEIAKTTGAKQVPAPTTPPP